MTNPTIDPRGCCTGTSKDDAVILDMALRTLHRFATENTGWRSFFRRWYFSDEPLRNDAANIVRMAQFAMPRPENTRIIGDKND